MTATLLPIGLWLGPGLPSASSGTSRDVAAADPLPVHRVSVGADMIELDAEVTAVFSRLRTMIRDQDDAATAPTREQAITSLDFPQAAGLVDRLLGQGLLLRVDPEGPLAALREVFTRHRLHPLAESQGLTSTEPVAYSVIGSDRRMRVLTAPTFAVWARARSTEHVWAACTDHARRSKRPVSEVVRALARALPGLVWSGCAFLDPVGPGPDRERTDPSGQPLVAGHAHPAGRTDPAGQTETPSPERPTIAAPAPVLGKDPSSAPEQGGSATGLGALGATAAVVAGVLADCGQAAEAAVAHAQRLAAERDRMLGVLGGGPPPEVADSNRLASTAGADLQAASAALVDAVTALRAYLRATV